MAESDNTPRTMRLAKDLAADYMSALDALAEGQKKRHMPSGFKTLDSRLGGWLHEGHLIIIAGRPAMGKSALAQQIAEQVAAQDKTVIFFTLEMSGYEITERAIARRSGVPVPRLKTASLSPDDWRAVTDAFGRFSALPLLVDDASFDIAGLMGKATAAAAGLEKRGLPPIGLIVVDYLQLVTAKAANRTLEIGQVTAGLKRLAKALQIPVIGLSQLNRGLEGRTDKRPTLADLRESGSIEQDADLVLLMYRDDYYDEQSADKGTAEIDAAKNRHGSTGTAKLAFVADRIMFGDLAHD